MSERKEENLIGFEDREKMQSDERYMTNIHTYKILAFCFISSW
jgi:hypothetical protein